MVSFRHSVYFETCDAADRAEARLCRELVLDDIYQSNDGESGLIEVRFFTARKLDRYEQAEVVRGACVYALNCEDF